MAIGGGELGAQAGADAVCLLPTHLLGLCADGKRGEGALADDAADRLPAGGDAVGANTRLRGGDGAWAAGNRRAGAVVPAAVSPRSPQCDFLGRRHSRNRHLRVENVRRECA